MKKRVVFMVIFLSIAAFTVMPKDLIKAGVAAGYFSPRDEIFKEVYDGGGDMIYGLKVGVRVWNGFFIWLSGSQYKKYSEMTFTSDITRLTLNPIDISLRYTASLGRVNPFLGLGYTYLLFKERSAVGRLDDEGSGLFVEAGLEFSLSSRFILDVGAKYSQIRVQPTDDEIDLGGLQAGVSFLVRF
jgi:opacity protein-like surface antigen